MIGEILNALERNGLSENTLIVYTTDHGEQVGEHGLWWKQTFYEDSARVPVILSWPGTLPEGTRCARVASHLDVTATMLEAIGAPPLPNSRGRGMLGLLRDPGDGEWEDVAFSEYCMDRVSDGMPYDVHAGPDGWFHRMVRREEWKLNYYHGMEPQLFNLSEDPHEMHDRAQDPACRKVREDLTADVLDGWDPEVVASRMAALQRDRGVLRNWAESVQPSDAYRWDLRPEMDFLDRMQR